MDQEKIDVARATPVTATPRKGMSLWLQAVLSLIVIALAFGGAALVNPTANGLVARTGLKLPLLTASADSTAPAAGGQRQGGSGQGGQQSGQAQTQTQTQAGGQTQSAGQSAGQGQGGGGRNGAGGARTAVVVTAAAGSGIINDKLTSIGEGSAIRSVTVATSQSGTLMTVAVKPGDRVAAGDKLATLDSGTEEIAYNKAKLAADDADATLTRTQSLAKSNSVSDAQLATAQLAAAQAQLALNDAKLSLDERTITTPIAGSIGLIQVTPGNLVNAQTVVTTVDDSSQILVNFWVPERYSSQIAIGAPVTATSDALLDKSFTGAITAIDNKIDPTSRTLQVQATLPNPDGIIKTGMSFTVEMNFSGEKYTSVDPLSIQWSNSGAYVWKVVANKAKKGMVTIIQRNSDGVLVTGDVQPGDPVVTQGVLQLTDGAAVRLLDAPQGTGAAAGQQQPTQQGGGDRSAASKPKG